MRKTVNKEPKELNYEAVLKWRRGLVAKEVSRKYDYIEEWNETDNQVTFFGFIDGTKTKCTIDREGNIFYEKCI